MNDSKPFDRVEGVIIAEELKPSEVAEFINSLRVVAAIDWYDRTPNLMGLTLAAEGRTLATVNDFGEIVASMEAEDLALDLATRFHAEVMIGEVAADALPDGAHVSDEHVEYSRDGISTVIELTRTPASSVPLFAALEGIDIAVKELGHDWRALVYTVRAGSTVGITDYPSVLLTMAEGDFEAILAAENDEDVTIYNWGLQTRTLAAGHTSGRIAEEAERLVGAVSDLRVIASAIEGADVAAAVASAQLRGPRAVSAFIRALGLPAAFAGVLLGERDLHDLGGVEIHEARGITNAIGRSVDKILVEPDSTDSPLWSVYHQVAVERPWIVRAAAAVEASIGTGLIINALRRGATPRSGWRILGGIIGAVMVTDSVAEVALAGYLGKRAQRSKERYR